MHRTLDNPPAWIRGVCDSQDGSRQAGTAQMEMEKGGKCARWYFFLPLLLCLCG